MKDVYDFIISLNECIEQAKVETTNTVLITGSYNNVLTMLKKYSEEIKTDIVIKKDDEKPPYFHIGDVLVLVTPVKGDRPVEVYYRPLDQAPSE